MTVTGQTAASAKIKANLIRSPSRKRPSLFPDFALHLEPLHALAQLSQLVPLSSCQSCFRADVDLSLGLRTCQPGTQRRLADVEVLGNLADASTAGLARAHLVRLELL